MVLRSFVSRIAGRTFVRWAGAAAILALAIAQPAAAQTITYGPGMAPNASNATLPDARTNLGASVSGGVWPVTLGGTGGTQSTGSGAVVLATAPTLTAPVLTAASVDNNTTGTLLSVENLSIANNTTKSASVDFYGRDTLNTRKAVGRILAAPNDANWSGGSAGGLAFYPEVADGAPSETVRFLNTGGIRTIGSVLSYSGTAIPAGGTAGAGYLLSSTANFGVFFGSGAPTLTAAKGSLYLRSDGTGAADRAYINTDGGTTWTAISTAG